MFDQKADTIASRNSEICLFCLSRTVYYTSHNRNLDIKRNILNHGFYLICKADQIDLGSSAGRTGNNFHPAFTESQCFQDPFG